MTKSAVRIQCFVRGRLARHVYAKQCFAAAKVQAYWKSCLAQRRLAKMRLAVRRIASMYKRWQYRGRVQSMKRLYQASLEAHNVHEPMAELERSRNAACVIQRFARGAISRHRLCTMLGAATKTQTAARCYISRRWMRRRFNALSTVQTHVDGSYQRWKRREKLKQLSCIQDNVKRWIAQKTFGRCRHAQIRIARTFRGMQGRRRARLLRRTREIVLRICRARAERARYVRKRTAAIRIQSYWRGWLSRDEIREWPASATLISTAWRMYRARSRYLKIRWAGHVLIGRWLTLRHCRRRGRR